jgi:hypothetical protein
MKDTSEPRAGGAAASMRATGPITFWCTFQTYTVSNRLQQLCTHPTPAEPSPHLVPHLSQRPHQVGQVLGSGPVQQGQHGGAQLRVQVCRVREHNVLHSTLSARRH